MVKTGSKRINGNTTVEEVKDAFPQVHWSIKRVSGLMYFIDLLKKDGGEMVITYDETGLRAHKEKTNDK